ncbi:MAG: hypothetical protein AAFV53_22525 [Myxococcota bacterium]
MKNIIEKATTLAVGLTAGGFVAALLSWFVSTMTMQLSLAFGVWMLVVVGLLTSLNVIIKQEVVISMSGVRIPVSGPMAVLIGVGLSIIEIILLVLGTYLIGYELIQLPGDLIRQWEAIGGTGDVSFDWRYLWFVLTFPFALLIGLITTIIVIRKLS